MHWQCWLPPPTPIWCQEHHWTDVLILYLLIFKMTKKHLLPVRTSPCNSMPRLVNSYIMQALSQIWSTIDFVPCLTKHWVSNLTITETFFAFFVTFVRILCCLSTSCLSSDSLRVQLPLDSVQPSLPSFEQKRSRFSIYRRIRKSDHSNPLGVFSPSHTILWRLGRLHWFDLIPFKDWNHALGFAHVAVGTVL